MRLIWVLCLCFVSLNLLAVRADDEPSETTLPDSETTTTLSKDLTADIEAVTSASTNSDDASPSDLTSAPSSEPTVDTTPVTSESTLATDESTSATTEVAKTKSTASEVNTTQVLISLSNQIKTILDHFQKANPVGLPGQEILPDPLPAPNVTDGLGIVSKSQFYDITVYGLSNFTVTSVNMMLAEMTVYVQIHMKVVYIVGNYTQQTGFFFSSSGPFNLTLSNVTAEGIVFLAVKPDGSLYANHSMTKVKYEKVSFHLGDKSTTAPLAGVVDAAGLAVIGTILPFIQSRIDERLTTEVNKKLKDSPPFPAIRDTSPADLLILKAREYVRKNYEPHRVQNMVKYEDEFLYLTVGPVTLQGLSNFARVGDISLGMVNRTMVTKARIVTGKVRGEGQFSFNFGKLPQRPTPQRHANFTVDRLQFEAIVHQSVDTRQKPRLEDLQLELGPIQAQLDNQGNFDYIIELALRQMPDYLRYYLIDILEEPIKKKIQKDILDEVNVEKMMTQSLPLLDKLLQENKV